MSLLKETTDEKHGLLWNHEEVTAILLRYPNVRAVLSGHYHSATQAIRGGIEFVVVAAFGDGGEREGCRLIAEELLIRRIKLANSVYCEHGKNRHKKTL